MKRLSNKISRRHHIETKLVILLFSFFFILMQEAFAEYGPALVSTPTYNPFGQAIDQSTNPAISSDGRYIVFESYASNLVSGDSNNVMDVFKRDIQTGDIAVLQRMAVGLWCDNNYF